MILTSQYAHSTVRAQEAAILLMLLGVHPHVGISFSGVVRRLNARGLSDMYISHLISRMALFNLIEPFYEDDDYYRVHYRLTTNGWLKAVALECSRGAVTACG